MWAGHPHVTSTEPWIHPGVRSSADNCRGRVARAGVMPTAQPSEKARPSDPIRPISRRARRPAASPAAWKRGVYSVLFLAVSLVSDSNDSCARNTLRRCWLWVTGSSRSDNSSTAAATVRRCGGEAQKIASPSVYFGGTAETAPARGSRLACRIRCLIGPPAKSRAF